MESLKKDKCTIDDIYALPDGERAELIDGQIYMMAPPSPKHQIILNFLSTCITNHIGMNKGKCRVFPAPFSVRLLQDDSKYFEPDISIVCDRDKIDDKGCNGAPDWIIEIVSPSSRKMDYGIKMSSYMQAGVREYWIVDPTRERITVYVYEQDWAPMIYGFKDSIKVGVFNDLEIDFMQLDIE